MSMLNKEELKALKKELPRGWQKDLIKTTNCSIGTITNVFKCECKDHDLIEAVITAAIKLKQAKEKREQAISKKIQNALA